MKEYEEIQQDFVTSLISKVFLGFVKLGSKKPTFLTFTKNMTLINTTPGRLSIGGVVHY